MTAEQRAEARRYGRISLGFTLADMAVDLVYLAIMAFVFARPLDAWLAGFQRWPARSRCCGCWRCLAS